jgi:hypothetical protein
MKWNCFYRRDFFALQLKDGSKLTAIITYFGIVFSSAELGTIKPKLSWKINEKRISHFCGNAVRSGSGESGGG